MANAFLDFLSSSGWDESKHKRDVKGRFTSGGASVSASTKPAAGNDKSSVKTALKQNVKKTLKNAISGTAPNGASNVKTIDIDDAGTIISGFARRDMHLEKSLAVTQGKAATVKQALKAVNPHYTEDIAYQENCPFAAFAYEMQRKGYAVEALAMPIDRTTAPFTNVFSAFVGKDGKSLKIEQAGDGKQALEGRLEDAEFPNGSRFAVMIKKEGKKYGHDFIAEKIKGKIVYVNSQNGLTAGEVKDVSHFFDGLETDALGRQKLYFARIDNAAINPNPKIDYTKAVKVIK